ncbi:hypothetical protein FV139_01375 [Parahaliea maris]|uniref:Bacterial repeat domain-containing protein n=1 Tax=Parahaliea maris TaxID=2716870 RepID=A0A5C9A5K6_9GAMM|nr:hypothetical protein [Parahaliea maris]TXS96185.1 hypothetical protein FV139_01375 [Parahaliea maris]
MRAGLLLILVAALSACRIQVGVPEHGEVASMSGSLLCESGSQCAVEVADIHFDETYTATPEAGYQFAGWKKGWRLLCGGSLEPCHLLTSGFEGNDQLMEFLASDEVFYLEPQFLEGDAIRRYQAGDVARFDGTLERSGPGADPAQSTAVAIRMAFAPLEVAGVDEEVLERQWRVTLEDSGVVEESVTAIFQDSKGALFDLKDADGNSYLDQATDTLGVLSIPSPAFATALSTHDYYLMYGGHTSGPITQGSRVVERYALEPHQLGAVELPAYRVIITDHYEYLVTYDEFRRDTSVAERSEFWIAPAKGLISFTIDTQVYSSSGVLQLQQNLTGVMSGGNF